MSKVVCILISLTAITVFDATCCDPAEIGQSYTLSWSGAVTNEAYISWVTSEIFIISCKLDTLNCSHWSPYFKANITKTSNNVIQAYLTFGPMVSDLYQRPYSIQVGYNMYNVCNALEVFNRSVSVNCTSYFETSVYSHVIVNCVSSNVFPRAKMTVGLPNYKTTSDCQKDTTVQPYVARCVGVIPVSYFILDTNNISVKIFPNVTEGERYSFQHYSTIVLELPKVELAKCPMGPDVKEDYIKNGTSASCLCVLSSLGYPPGQAQWYQINKRSYTEVGTNEVNGSARITIDVDQNAGNLNYTCKGKSVLGRSAEDLYFPIQVAYPVEITRFTSNSNTTTLIVTDKSSVVFQCEVSNTTTPAVVVIKKRTSGAVINTSTIMSCVDSGEYVCRATDLIFGTTQERSITVYVQCALHLTNTESERNVLKAILKTNLITKIEVYGYPAPTYFTLIRRETGNVNHIVSNSSTKDNKKYLFDYSMQSLPYGNLYLTIYNVTSVDFTNYTLRISNGWGSELVYIFLVTEEMKTDSTSTSDVLPAAIGGSLAGAVLIALIILLIIKRKDMQQIKSLNCTKRHGVKEDNGVVIPKRTVHSVPQKTENTGYEEVNLAHNYDRIEQNEDQRARYQKVNTTRLYDEIDPSQIAIEQKYEHVTITAKGSYQNHALPTSNI